jgi:hypothetical protein
MIERLVIALRALGGSVDEQLARSPDFVTRPQELALDFDDAYLLLQQCQQLELSVAERDAVAAVDELLEQLRGPEHRGLWTAGAIRSAPEWKQVRKAARAALRTLGYAEGPAPPGLTHN